MAETFQLTEEAVFEIDSIWQYILETAGLEQADRIATELFKVFQHIGTAPARGIGDPT